jgi:hypothetical protein
MRFVTIVAFALAVCPAVAAYGQSGVSPSDMSPSQIKAHNAGLDPADPNYIKCRKSEVMGSLVKKQRVCRTIAQWKETSALGNEGTREMVEGFARSGGSNGN